MPLAVLTLGVTEIGVSRMIKERRERSSQLLHAADQSHGKTLNLAIYQTDADTSVLPKVSASVSRSVRAFWPERGCRMMWLRYVCAEHFSFYLCSKETWFCEVFTVHKETDLLFGWTVPLNFNQYFQCVKSDLFFSSSGGYISGGWSSKCFCQLEQCMRWCEEFTSASWPERSRSTSPHWIQ